MRSVSWVTVQARRAPGRGQNQSRGLAQGPREMLRLPVQTEAPFGLVAHVDEHGAAARAIAGFDVVENVADKPRSREVDIELARGLHATFGLEWRE